MNYERVSEEASHGQVLTGKMQSKKNNKKNEDLVNAFIGLQQNLSMVNWC